MIGRRAFAAGLAASAFADGAAGAVPAIDTHVHFYDPGRPGGVPWPSKKDELLYRRVMPDDFRRVTAGLGVDAVVVVEASPLFEDNQWILDIAKDDRLIAGFIGHLDPGAAEFNGQLRGLMRNRLFRGIRLGGKALAQGLGEAAFRRGLEALGDSGLTLDVLGGPDMIADVVRLAKLVPKLKVVVDHLPFDVAVAAPEQRNVFAKISNVRPTTTRGELESLWREWGEDRVMYGSNWPVCERVLTYKAALDRLREFAASAGNAEAFFALNSREAYGWKDRR